MLGLDQLPVPISDEYKKWLRSGRRESSATLCFVFIAISSLVTHRTFSAFLASMKFHAVLLALASAAVAVPTADATSVRRQNPDSIVDQLTFGISLPQFTARRNKRDPSTLDWSSDGCTSSPDNPFGFPFLPACQRHDFGYQNFRAQKRFTKSAKAEIDTRFKSEYVL